MARAYRECPHVDDRPQPTIKLSVLEVEPSDGGRFMRRFPFPESAGCDECRAKWGVADRYFAVALEPGQSVVDALLEAAKRLGGPLYALAIASVQGEPPSGGGNDLLGGSDQTREGETRNAG